MKIYMVSLLHRATIIIEGVCVQVVVDTGAEVSILSLSISQTVLPHQSLPSETKFVIKFNQLVWLYWPKPPVRMKYKSYNDFGLVHGKSSDFKHRWS